MYTKSEIFSFEWDEKKALKNKKIHGVSFEQAITVFDDPSFIDDYDVAHSDQEDRFVRIGLSDGDVLVVVFTERRRNTFRIITARYANRKEEKLYYEKQAH